MSHKIVKVNSVAPDSTGNVSIPVGSLTDTTVTNPQNGDRLDFDGSAWTNSAPGGGGGGLAWFRIGGKDSEVPPLLGPGVGQSGGIDQNVGNQPDNNPFNNRLLTNYANLAIHDPAPVSSSGFNVVVEADANDWITKVTPPVGKYILELQMPIAPAYWVIQWNWTGLNSVGVHYKNSSNIWTRATTHPAPNGGYNTHRQGSVARGYVDFSTEAYALEFKCFGTLNSGYLYHNNLSHFTMIKVG